MKGRYDALCIETSEGISFQYNLASPVSRCIALIVDLLVVWALIIVSSVLIQLLSFVSMDVAMAAYFILYFLISIGYFLVLEFVWKGQTVGKKMMRLKVMDLNGYRLRVDQIVMRNLMRFVDSLPVFYLVGGITSTINRRSQRLGDLIAGTVVVRIAETEIPSLSEVADSRYNSFRDHPRLEAQLRERVTPEQANLALQALRRRDALDSTARVELFSEMAKHFKDLVTFPDDIADILSDEQYVRNCVDSIFRSAK